MLRRLGFFLFFIAAFSLVSPASFAAAKIDTRSGKYAALVMDADTGEVLFSRSADAKRYPASLTKMMTVYLLFEALAEGRMNMSTPMRVSAKAANQPQTNISLKEGQTIRVSDAIRALIVRSANDVAMVVAENLAGSEERFAQQMTQKARELDMRRTVFQNPHGLPDEDQYTTARDMAKLGIALRRDFPQYYNFFKTSVFRWAGKTYKSHNRVLNRFGGVDGIKTGYIRMSGFNLVSSVKRDGYHIMAVVMGGQSSQTRDDHMVSLLQRTYKVLAERGDRPREFANAPVPTRKPDIAANEAPFSAKVTPKELPTPIMPVRTPSQVALVLGSARIVPQKKPIAELTDSPFQVVSSTESLSAPDSEAQPSGQTLQLPEQTIQQASLQPVAFTPDQAAPAVKGDWGIQVGAFQDERSALYAAANAVKLARDPLRHSQVLVTDQGRAGASIHRARLSNLSEYDARRACQELVANNAQCFVFRTTNLTDL